MPSIGSILRTLGSVPRRIRDAQYEDDPMQDSSGTIPVLIEGEEVRIPIPDEMRGGAPPGKKRSKFGDFVQDGLPEIIRGGVVAASSPTRGHVGSAGDIFGALRAVGEDKTERDMLSMQIRRQHEQDAMKRRLDEAHARNYESQADLNEWRTQQTKTGKDKRDPIEAINAEIENMERQYGRKLTEREKQTKFGTHGPQYDVRTDDNYWNKRLADAKTPEETEAIKKERRETEGGIAEAKAAGRGKGGAPWMRPFTFNTTEGAKLVRPNYLGGKMAGTESVDVQFTRPTPPERKAAPRQPGPADERLAREKKVKSIVNRLLSEDANKSPETTLRNVQQFYQNDPEVAEYRSEILASLQHLTRGAGAAAKAEGVADVEERAKQRRLQRDKAKGAPSTQPSGSPKKSITKVQVEAYAQQNRVSYEVAKKKAQSDGYEVVE